MCNFPSFNRPLYFIDVLKILVKYLDVLPLLIKQSILDGRGEITSSLASFAKAYAIKLLGLGRTMLLPPDNHILVPRACGYVRGHCKGE